MFRGSYIAFTISIACLIAGCEPSGSSTNGSTKKKQEISLQKYNSVELGASFDHVCKILGGKPDAVQNYPQNDSEKLCTWVGEVTSMSVWFRNNIAFDPDVVAWKYGIVLGEPNQLLSVVESRIAGSASL